MVTYSISKKIADRKAIGYYLVLEVIEAITQDGPDLAKNNKLAAVRDAR